MTVLAPEWLWTPTGLCAGWSLEFTGTAGEPALHNTPRSGSSGTIVGLFPPERQPPGAVRLPGRLILPGMVNAHSHAFQRAFRGHVQWRPTGRDDFWSWRDRMYTVASSLSPEGIEAVSALAFLEMAEAGITRVGEFHYLHHQPDGTPYGDPDELAKRVIAAARAVGIRIALLRVAYARGGPGAPLRPDQRRFRDDNPQQVLEAAERLGHTRDAGVTTGIAPHSVRAVDAAFLAGLADWKGVVHAHVSEQPAENAACQLENGCSPLALLARCGLVSERFSAVHLTHPLEGDVDLLAAAGGAVVVCPSTELDLGDGFFPVEARERLRLCLGSDSHARIDPLEEARALELHARGLAGRRNVLSPEGAPHGLAERLLCSATIEGDRALGGPGLGLAPGAPADLVVVDLRRPAAEGVPPLEAAVFGGTPEWVEQVWVGGRQIVADGRHPDRERILAAARAELPG